MKKNVVPVPGLFQSVKTPFLLLIAASVIFLSSCATNQGNYKFAVLLYDNPVYVPQWKYDDTQSSTPEGAALNIVTAMQLGDMSHWLANWDAPDRPSLSADQQLTLLREWQQLKDERVYMIGRVVAEQDVIVEISTKGPTQQTLKFPLKHVNDQWRLTSMDSRCDYLNWENSTNKIVEQMQATMLQKCMLNDSNLVAVVRQ